MDPQWRPAFQAEPAIFDLRVRQAMYMALDRPAIAEGTQAGIPLSFDETYTVAEGQLLSVPLVLKSQALEYLTPGQLRCMVGAKNQEDVLKCLPQNRKNLVVKAGLERST